MDIEITNNNLSQGWPINGEDTDLLNTLLPQRGDIGSNIPLIVRDSENLLPREISGYGPGDWLEVEIMAEELEISSDTDILGVSEDSLMRGQELEGDRLLGMPAIPRSLEVGDISKIAEEAIDKWSETELGRSLPVNWDEVVFQVADLPGAILGQVERNKVIIDSTAAGYGWFIDETPWEDTEFGLSATGLKAEEGSPAEGKIDLLSVLSHELGHVLGLDDSTIQGELMSGSLGVGDRRLPRDAIGIEFIPEEELLLPHNLVVGDGVKNALVSGLNKLAEELDSYSEDLGNQLLASIPGLLKDGGAINSIKIIRQSLT
ncbi:matrixin family metalloprotease [Okeania sp.]|uniref:matrixin family metalloprotease n=1 Tax=Okeania sp. TaxID=3100323 RepID=UPI002B4AD00E|nr:matrixin family metalloprotease [Okeania sp.]MEB3339669.1 matrixin family metalloprotease [Okeania sp.]